MGQSGRRLRKLNILSLLPADSDTALSRKKYTMSERPEDSVLHAAPRVRKSRLSMQSTVEQFWNVFALHPITF